MKKICISFIILLLIFSTQAFAFEDVELSNKKRQEASQNALVELMEKYKTDEVSEEERILDYTWCGGGYDFSKEDQGIFKATCNFTVTPYKEENSIWKKDFRYVAFAKFSIVDGEYILDKVSLEPENYDNFLERFEEYQKKGEEVVEVQAVSAEKTEDLKTNKIEKMSNTIFISSSIVLGIVVLLVIVSKIKKVKKLNWGI